MLALIDEEYDELIKAIEVKDSNRIVAAAKNLVFKTAFYYDVKVDREEGVDLRRFEEI